MWFWELRRYKKRFRQATYFWQVRMLRSISFALWILGEHLRTSFIRQICPILVSLNNIEQQIYCYYVYNLSRFVPWYHKFTATLSFAVKHSVCVYRCSLLFNDDGSSCIIHNVNIISSPAYRCRTQRWRTPAYGSFASPGKSAGHSKSVQRFGYIFALGSYAYLSWCPGRLYKGTGTFAVIFYEYNLNYSCHRLACIENKHNVVQCEQMSTDSVILV